MNTSDLTHGSALLGHTGFVGSNLARSHRFDACYNSRNINDARGCSFDLVVCSAVSAVKWQANRDPGADWAKIQSLLDALVTIKARRFVLISTIDVYANPRSVDERTDPSSAPNHAYGEHRARVELFVRERFAVSHIIRLPGLFGAGLKKNIIFDLLHDNCLESINPESSFQYYDLGRLWTDLEKVIAEGLPLLNLATEPVKTSHILDRFFADKQVGAKAGALASYDFRSQHAALWGGANGYLYDAATVLDDLARFITSERKA